jgi:DNA-directed RNA polymerase subunit M/transcription elongation factor TFIIS
MSSAVTANTLRNKVVERIVAATGWSDLYARDCDVGIYNATIDMANKYDFTKLWSDRNFVRNYITKALQVLSYLHSDSYVSNVHLKRRIRDGDIKPHQIASMRPEELFPDRWHEMVDLKVKRNDSLINSKQVARTDQFKCFKCKKNECTFYEMQIRSADEPSSIFVTCLNCGNKWRIG